MSSSQNEFFTEWMSKSMVEVQLVVLEDRVMVILTVLSAATYDVIWYLS
jgi:hypothetical protein